MKMKTIEARPIGWMMQWRSHKIHKLWKHMPGAQVYDSRRECIEYYDRHDYHEMTRAGLWRHVAVYVEVSDEKA